MPSRLRISYLLLSLGLLFSVWLITLSVDNVTAADVGLNLATEIAGILLTVFLVDRVIKQQEAERETKYAELTFRRLRMPASNHMHLWVKITKSCMLNKPTDHTMDFAQLIERHMPTALPFFDARTQASVFPPMLWHTYILHELDAFRNQVKQILDVYAVFLSPDDLEAIERCLNSDFMTMMPQLLQMLNGGLYPNISGVFLAHVEGSSTPQLMPYILPHVSALNGLVHMLNSRLDAHMQIAISPNTWSDTIGPKIGSARLR